MKNWQKLLAPLLILVLLLAACGGSGEAKKEDGKIQVYTTVYPLTYLTQQIGGSYVHVKSIYPAGADAHSFEPTQKDMLKLADSDLFFYIGLGMEGFVDKAKSTLKEEKVSFIPLAEKLDLPKDPDAALENDEHEHEGEEHEHEHGDINPHVWLYPKYMEEMAKTIRDRLTKEMPKQKATFEENYKKTVEKLKKLDDSYAEMAKNAKHKDFVTAHAAYSYWNTAYGLHQIPIAGISTSDEPSQKKLQTIVQTIKKDKIPYIMLEQNTNSKIADVIQSETDTKALTLHNLETLTEKDIHQNRDYLSIMNDNLKALKEALNY
ncbi:metal ABC transporter substrate-binding protein [Listeria aquatica]|uniref:Zinc ABC transporter substrate-binding protein n=1 Tax=Listeria aquatica TaxID=1494960 RepID=A0A841ZKF0_9LIST|nr:metal ABC transporter substrate-binding protein [Listeria aquatica]MBC1521159.1 zinc ABC transporter substrate-binding protein [Listeria aquatica]